MRRGDNPPSRQNEASGKSGPIVTGLMSFVSVPCAGPYYSTPCGDHPRPRVMLEPWDMTATTPVCYFFPHNFTSSFDNTGFSVLVVSLNRTVLPIRVKLFQLKKF